MAGDGIPKSPFFRPRERQVFSETPGGTQHLRKKKTGEAENKSTIAGCTANVINAVVGAGIVGLPYAVQQTGFVAGIVLILFCGIMTEKSLRLLVETAKHAHVPSYETVAEAAFGRFGFLFVAINMFIMSYGAMLSYLMVVKDTFSAVFGVDPDDLPMKRAILFVISISIMVPLSSQRDMADLAKTSRINVCFDIIMVMLVLYCAPIKESWAIFEWKNDIIRSDTIFIGLGVLSFAFVCQHSAFIIAGSLERPTKDRWGRVTITSLSFCCSLALICGIGGFVGFQEKTQGNILNSLDNSLPANIARALLGTTMLFVYPMESFVSRHVCVVLFFQGRSAHEGDDTSVLSRRDRRITLTFLLYLSAVIPASLAQNVGIVLAASGAIGGSCLSYIGPGAVYVGIHGGRFLEMSRSIFGRPVEPAQSSTSEELEPLYSKPVSADLDPLNDSESWLVHKMKDIAFYVLLMPVWCKVAEIGKSRLTSHITELAMQTPHPIRIGNVRFASAKIRGGSTRVVMIPNKGSASAEHRSSDSPITTTLIRADSLPRIPGIVRMNDGQIVALPDTPNQTRKLIPPKNMDVDVEPNYQSIQQQQVGSLSARRAKEEEFALEDDPQQIPPSAGDFAIAIFYILFGIIAMLAGLYSIYEEVEEE